MLSLMGSADLFWIEQAVHSFDSRNSKCFNTLISTSAFLFYWLTVLWSVVCSVREWLCGNSVVLPFAPTTNEIAQNSWEATQQSLKQFSQVCVSKACSTRHLTSPLCSDRLDKNRVGNFQEADLQKLCGHGRILWYLLGLMVLLLCWLPNICWISPSFGNY